MQININAKAISIAARGISITAGMVLLAASLLPFISRQNVVSPSSPVRPGVSLSSAQELAGRQSLSFEPNGGQTDPSVRFVAHAPGGVLFFTQAGATFALKSPGSSLGTDMGASDTNAVRLDFVGASPAAVVSAGSELPSRVSYFIGNNPASWHNNLPTYAGISYNGLYDGITLNFGGTQGVLKGTYTLAAGADPSVIRWRYTGAARLELDQSGDLLVDGTGSEPLLTEQAPLAWQTGGSGSAGRLPVEVHFVLGSDGTVGFALGAYDRAEPLTIDPSLIFSTYLGGTGRDEAYGVAADPSGNVYITGFTGSTNFPTVNPYQPTNHGTPDAFVTKFNANGTVAYSTYVGGTVTDSAYGIAVDSAGNAYITGYTSSTDFPITQNAYQPTSNGLDAFLTKLNATGSTLLYSTYFGGTVNDYAYGVAVDGSGNAYITGNTGQNGTGFPLVNAYQATYGGGTTDAFLARVNTTRAGAASLIYSTYLGGSSSDYGGTSAASSPGHGVAADGSGNAYITGETSSANFPTVNAYDPTLTVGTDAWVAKVNTNLVGGPSLIYSTYLGGSGCCDYGRDIDIDASGSAYVTGQTNSTDFPTLNPYQSCVAGPFVTKFNAAGNGLIYSTCFGAGGAGEGADISVDNTGRAHVVGSTSSSTFPQMNSLQTYQGGGDAFALILGAAGNNLVFSTFLGGTANDVGIGGATDGANKSYVTGSTLSTDFPIQSPYQPSSSGGVEAFVSSIDGSAPVATATPIPTCSVAWNSVDSPNPSGMNGNALVDVAAAAANDVWAVGTSADYTSPNPTAVALMEHWDGAKWSILSSPPANNVSMGGVAALPGDAWAVGDYDSPTATGHQPLLEHWDGSTWSLAASPAITVPVGGIRDVRMVSSSNVWVVGSYVQGAGTQALALHWNGSVWAQVAMPILPNRDSLQGLAAVSANDIWAVGEVDANRPLFMHWNGTSWTRFNNPAAVSGVLYRVAAVSATDIWAVGYTTDGSGLPLAMHYNGTSWSVVTMPLPCCNRELTDVAAISSNNVWAVSENAFVHWDGTTWTLVSGAGEPPSTKYFLQGLGKVSATDVWAVGKAHTDAGGSFDGTLIEHYSTICPPPSATATATYTPDPNFTATATSTPGPAATDYVFVAATGTIVPGTTDTGNHCDNCENTIVLPFPATLYGQQFSSATLGSNGTLGFISNSNPSANTCLPTGAADFAIFGYWDDLVTDCTGCGIFTSVSGTTPNRIFNIEWRAARLMGSGVNFEIRLYEGSDQFDLIYGQIDPESSETVGVQQGANGLFTNVLCVLAGSPEQSKLARPDGWIIEDGVKLIFGQPRACTLTFIDVPVGSTFYPYIHCLACLGIINGYSDGTFKPNNNVTRGQLSKIVTNAAGFSDPQPAQMFQDVPVGSTFQLYIGRLASRGYISGYACGGPNEPCVQPRNLPYFRPNNNATRGQITKIDANAAEFGDAPTGRQFQDVPIGSTYYTYTYRLVTRSIMAGYRCGEPGEPCIPPANLPYFRPNNNATRGQTSKIEGNTFFPDCAIPAAKDNAGR